MNFENTESRFTRETKTPSRDDMLLVQSIQITDKFGFDKQTALEKSRASSETVFVASEAAAFCVNGLGMCELSMPFSFVRILNVFFFS